MSDHIPFEIQVEIIKRLPVKSLIRSRSVSKPWKSLIDSSDFIAATIHSPARQNNLLIRYGNLSSEETYVSVVDDDAFPQNKFPLTVPPMVQLLRGSKVVGSSHGLVCLFGFYLPGDLDFTSGSPMAVLWNPSIRKSVAIAVPDVDWFYVYMNTAFGFGVCPATSDPKIVKITDKRKHASWQVEVYSLSSGVWRSSIGNLPAYSVVSIQSLSQAVIDRFVYWFVVGSGFNLLLSFDLSSEEFREIYLPDELAFHEENLYIFKRIDSLAVLQEWLRGDVYDVWMMENGDLKSFTKLFTINLSYISSDCLPAGFRRNGELLMARTDDADNIDAFMNYDPVSEQINDLEIIDQFNSLLLSSYTESLILFDQ